MITAAVGDFLLTAMLLLSAVMTFAFKEEFRRMPQFEQQQVEDSVLVVVGLVLLLSAALAAATGVGLLRRAGWARVMHWVLFAPSLLCCGNVVSAAIPILCLVGGILISSGSGAAWFSGSGYRRRPGPRYHDAF